MWYHPKSFKKFTDLITLARNGGLSGYEQLYSYVILDENEMNQTLVVGLYKIYVYNINGQWLSLCSNKMMTYLTLM